MSTDSAPNSSENSDDVREGYRFAHGGALFFWMDLNRGDWVTKSIENGALLWDECTVAGKNIGHE